jgi:hypothetical protein
MPFQSFPVQQTKRKKNAGISLSKTHFFFSSSAPPEDHQHMI